MKVLLIDDDPVEEKLFRALIRQMGRSDIELTAVVSIEDAKVHLEEAPVDLVLLDNRLAPHRDYRDTMPMLSDCAALPRIVLLSAAVDDISRRDAASFGIDRVVDKFEIREEIFGDLLAG